MTKQLPPLTEFQKTILWAVERAPNRSLNTWQIAEIAFPEIWKRRASRGALIGNIRRAANKMPDFVDMTPGRDRWKPHRIHLKHMHWHE